MTEGTKLRESFSDSESESEEESSSVLVKKASKGALGEKGDDKMNFPCILGMLASCPVLLTLSLCVVSGGGVLRKPRSRGSSSDSESGSDEERVSARKRSRLASVSKKKRSRSASVSKEIRPDVGRDAKTSALEVKTSRKGFGEG